MIDRDKVRIARVSWEEPALSRRMRQLEATLRTGKVEVIDASKNAVKLRLELEAVRRRLRKRGLRLWVLSDPACNSYLVCVTRRGEWWR